MDLGLIFSLLIRTLLGPSYKGPGGPLHGGLALAQHDWHYEAYTHFVAGVLMGLILVLWEKPKHKVKAQ